MNSKDVVEVKIFMSNSCDYHFTDLEIWKIYTTCPTPFKDNFKSGNLIMIQKTDQF